jgi:sulfur carrier protein
VNIYVNGRPRQVDLPAGSPTPRGVAVALDGTVVPRARLADTALHEGARIEVVTAVQGG